MIYIAIRIDRTGEIISINGVDIKILTYKNSHEIYIEVQDDIKYKTWTTYTNIRRGIRNPYDKKTCGVGYLGLSLSKENGKLKNSYKTWNGMIKRCYDKKSLEKDKTYIGCTVCEEWLCFETFEKWYNNNYYECDGELMNLDKDILFKGNKIYSPDKCVFAPKRINCLFIKSDKLRNGLIGTTKKYNGKYKAQYPIATNGKRTTKTFISELEAFNAYKQAKEKYIKQIADEYYDKLPTILYKAMYKYEVDIND